jgi:hypothetical protein
MDNIIHYDYLFPNYLEKNLQNKLKIDYESVRYITSPSYSKKIIDIIVHHLIDMQSSPKKLTIADICAGNGGDTIGFSPVFKSVSAYEIENDRYNNLLNNLSVYQLKNVKCYNVDCLTSLDEISKHDVVYIDALWGPNYKLHTKLKINIDKTPIEDVCIKLASNVKLVALKLPLNYDTKWFEQKMTQFGNTLSIHKLKKMQIFIVKKRSPNN